jgi:hypothetical protein
MERRRGAQTSSTPLPVDYIKMVTEVFTSNFDGGLQALTQASEGRAFFEASGAVYADEVVLCLSLQEEGQLAATTVYASSDFDPKASAPTVQDLLSACVDAVGALYAQLLDTNHPDRIEQLASHSLSAMDGVPFHWSEVRIDRYRIYMKVDKANPKLESEADEWLSKNDPDLKKLEEQNEEDAKNLFVTGPKKGSGSLH